MSRSMHYPQRLRWTTRCHARLRRAPACGPAYLTGGLENPFTFLLITAPGRAVHVDAHSGSPLRSACSTITAATASPASTMPLPWFRQFEPVAAFSLRHRGLWAALSVSSILFIAVLFPGAQLRRRAAWHGQSQATAEEMDSWRAGAEIVSARRARHGRRRTGSARHSRPSPSSPRSWMSRDAKPSDPYRLCVFASRAGQTLRTSWLNLPRAASRIDIIVSAVSGEPSDRGSR